jgi:hypothetical protein
MLRLLCGCALLFMGACSHRVHDGAAVAPLAAAAAPEDVVATVDGRPITAAAIAAQARARGVDARSALSDLVDAEVLAGEAARRHLDGSLDAKLAARGAMVRQLLHDTFERDVTPADVPPDLVRKAFNRSQPYINHDVYVDVWHILFRVPKDAPPAVRQQARALADEAVRRGKGQSLETFKALDQLGQGAPSAQQPIIVDKAQELMTERDGWTQKSFSYPAFTLKKPGDTVLGESSFGYHAIYLVRYLPPVHTTLPEVEGKIRQDLFEADVQKKAFAHFVDEIMAKHHVESHPERLPADAATAP